jgi:hypothetical protein
MKYLVSVMSCGVMLTSLSGCGDGMSGGMSIEDLIAKEGSSNPFVFHDFRIGMTRGEVYHVLDGARLRYPDEPRDSSYEEWVSEISVPFDVGPTQTWSGLPNNPYAAVYAFGMDFDDGHKLVPRTIEDGEKVIITTDMLNPKERRARLLAMEFIFIREEGVSTSIIEACERRFAELQSTQAAIEGALFFGWRHQPGSSRGQQHFAALVVREGDPSGYFAMLAFGDAKYYMEK